MNRKQQEAKKYLSQAFGLNQRIESKLNQIEELHNLAAKVTAAYSDMPKSPNRDGSRNGRYRLQDHRPGIRNQPGYALAGGIEEGDCPQNQSCGEYGTSDGIRTAVPVLYEMGRNRD